MQKNSQLYILGCNKGCKSRNNLIYTLYCGEWGIRTPGTVIPYVSLANWWFQPLTQLSWACCNTIRVKRDANIEPFCEFAKNFKKKHPKFYFSPAVIPFKRTLRPLHSFGSLRIALWGGGDVSFCGFFSVLLPFPPRLLFPVFPPPSASCLACPSLAFRPSCLPLFPP